MSFFLNHQTYTCIISIHLVGYGGGNELWINAISSEKTNSLK